MLRPSARFSLTDESGTAYQPVVLSRSLLFGRGAVSAVSREDALSIPGVQRGRNMICGAISTLPLEAVDERNRRVRHPLFRQLDPNVANVVMMAQTIEDLMFESIAWWRITSFTFDERGYMVPASVQRYEPGKVKLDPPTGYDRGYLPSGQPSEGVVWMDGHEVPYDQVIRFDSPNPPILEVAARSIRRAIALDEAAEMYAREPRPMDYFTSADQMAEPLTQEEMTDLLDGWREARRTRSTAYVPQALTYNEVQSPTPADLQLVQLQQRVTLDVANALGLSPEELGISTTSRSYLNGQDMRKDKVNDVYAPFMKAITDRLGMPDVTRPGVTPIFALDDYLKADPKTRAEVQQIYVSMGVMSREYVAGIEGLPPEAVPAAEPAPRLAINAGEASVGTERQVTESALSRPPSATFSRHTVAFEAATQASFAVDGESRTITGLAVPWNQTASSNGRRYRFGPGTLKYASVQRVKLLRDHSPTAAIGRAIKLTETDRGLEATFRIAAGRAGDEALALAAEEVLDGLSIGVDFKEEHVVPDPLNPGGYLVTQAALREISLTAMPAFDDSRLTSVRASDQGGQVDTCSTCGAKLELGVAHTCAPANFASEMASEFAAFMASRRPAGGGSQDSGQSGDGNAEAGNPPPRTAKERNNAAVAGNQHDRVDAIAPADGGQVDPKDDPRYRPGDPTSSAYVDDKHPEGRVGPAPTWPGRDAETKRENVNDNPPQDAQFMAEFAEFMARRRPVVDPSGRRIPMAAVREALPYRFSRPGPGGEMRFASDSMQPNGANFMRDLQEMARRGDDGSNGGHTAAGKRVMSLINATFDVDTADVNELSPNIQRPDMYVDQRDYRTPIMDIIGRGAMDGNGTPFTFPKFSSASGLVGNHTEGTEPASGTFVTTDQTITPSAISGKASLTREVWTRPGNPQTATLVWNQMVRGYWEALESAAAAFLATLTAATDISLNTGATGGAAPTSAQLSSNWQAAIAGLQFIRGYDFTAFVIEANLYQAFVAATDSAGAPLYPIINPMNRNGTARQRFQTLDLNGVEGIPSWALTATAGSVNASYLFDPSTVYGWNTPPERLEFPGTAPAGGGAYAPVAMVDLAIWGWKAFANTDIGGVREVKYDTTT